MSKREIPDGPPMLYGRDFTLGPRVILGGEIVCGYCDSGHARDCPYHFNDNGGGVGLAQFLPSTWGTA